MAFAADHFARMKIVDIRAHFHNFTHEFMPYSHWHRDRGARPVIPFINVQIGTADTRVADTDQNVVNANVRFRNIQQTEPGCGLRFDKSFHIRMVERFRQKKGARIAPGPFLLNVLAMQSELPDVGLFVHLADNRVVVALVGLANRITASDFRAITVVTGGALCAGAGANRLHAFHRRAATAVVTGLATGTGTAAIYFLLANRVAGRIIAGRLRAADVQGHTGVSLRMNH